MDDGDLQSPAFWTSSVPPTCFLVISNFSMNVCFRIYILGGRVPIMKMAQFLCLAFGKGFICPFCVVVVFCFCPIFVVWFSSKLKLFLFV